MALTAAELALPIGYRSTTIWTEAEPSSATTGDHPCALWQRHNDAANARQHVHRHVARPRESYRLHHPSRCAATSDGRTTSPGLRAATAAWAARTQLEQRQRLAPSGPSQSAQAYSRTTGVNGVVLGVMAYSRTTV